MDISHRIQGPEAVFAWSWQMIKTNWKKLFGIAVVPIALGYLGNIVLYISPSLIIVGVILYVAAFILSVAMVPSMIFAIDDLANQGGIPGGNWWSKYKRGFKIFWPMLLVMILAVLLALGATFLFIIPGIIVIMYMMFYIYSVTLDGRRGYDAFKYSFSLVRGRWWAVLARVIFMVIVAELFYLITFLAGLLLTGIFGAIGAGIVSPIVMSLVAICVVPILLMFSYAYQYRLYKDLKENPLSEGGKERVFRNWLVVFTVVGAVVLIGFTFVFIKIAPYLSQAADYRSEMLIRE